MFVLICDYIKYLLKSNSLLTEHLEDKTIMSFMNKVKDAISGSHNSGRRNSVNNPTDGRVKQLLYSRISFAKFYRVSWLRAFQHRK